MARSTHRIVTQSDGRPPHQLAASWRVGKPPPPKSAGCEPFLNILLIMGVLMWISEASRLREPGLVSMPRAIRRGPVSFHPSPWAQSGSEPAPSNRLRRLHAGIRAPVQGVSWAGFPGSAHNCPAAAAAERLPMLGPSCFLITNVFVFC